MCLKSAVLAAIAALMFVTAVPASGQATASDTLHQYVQELQKTPGNAALRERIVALAADMHPAPPIPETAREHYVMALTFMEAAKDAAGYEQAIAEYQAALLAAPWWAEAYRRIAIACKTAGRYDEAISSLTLYLASQPGDARDAQDEIYKLRALKRVTRPAEPLPPSAAQVSPPPRRSAFDELMEKINGRRYTATIDTGITLVIDVEGKGLVYGTSYAGVYERKGRFEVQGRVVTVPQPGRFRGGPVSDFTIVISEDGLTLTEQVRYTDGDSRTTVYRWQR